MRFSLVRFNALLIAFFLLSSCGETAVEVNICETASQHLSDCGLANTPLPNNCAETDANEIIALSCDELTNPGKADLFSDVLCRIGVLFKCDVDQCEAGQPENFESWDACGQYISAPTDSDCASCDYYRCRAGIAEQSCDVDNYYLEFGNKYCLRYAQMTEAKLSDEGQLWSQRIRTCLMNFAEDNILNEDTCIDVQRAAIESHTDCYTSTGFCALPVSDWLKVLATVSPSDFEFKSALITGVNCIKEFSEENPGVIDTP